MKRLKGQRTDGIQRFLPLPAEDGRAKADGEFVDPDPQQLGKNKMAEFMDEDHHQKTENCHQDRPNVTPQPPYRKQQARRNYPFSKNSEDGPHIRPG